MLKGNTLSYQKRQRIYQYPVADPTDKRIYVWGLAEHGALGNHVQNRKSKVIKRHFFLPVRLQFGELHKVVDFTCGYGFTAFAVQSKGTHKVFGCGINTDSQIGYHAVRRNHPLSIILNPLPIDIPFVSPNTIRIKQVAAGRAHLLVLTETEGVYLLGNNAYGQCGRKIVESEDYSGHPIINNITHLEGNKINKIECGQDHSLFITETGKVYTCGWGADGQTGSGHYGNSYHPSQVKGDIEGEIITKVACSVDCVLALNNKGEIFGWGNSEYGQLVSPEEKVQLNAAVYLEKCRSLGKIVDIAAGGSFCMAVNEEGALFVWGFGILGKGPKVDHSLEPTNIPSTLFGQNEFEPHSKVVGIEAGIGHMAATTNSGNLYMWGHNRSGCLGLGHMDDQFFPLRVSIGASVQKVRCGVDHTVALCQPFV
ncbi:Probable E3 ubiquitin-protein ligase HERC2 [Gryllus bimaculatus]|nr:Probable E3 ubiquitin-protein ligase HERC2 [Gryllus bimaculatus]